MFTLWIVHRDSLHRSALIRAAGAPEDAICGAPGDPIFAAAPLADVILLGLSGDFEVELEFAHRAATRAPHARWILVPERSRAHAVRDLFDGIEATILSEPPDARALRAQIRKDGTEANAMGRAAIPLTQRSSRDALAQRFSRWFADLDLPELLLALNPQLAETPLLVLGEEGTGKGLLAHYVHLFGANPASALAHIPCEAGMSIAALRSAFSEALLEGSTRFTVWLDGVDALPPSTQRQLARWVEFGLPPQIAHAHIVRWIATCGDEPAAGSTDALHPALRDGLAGIALRIPSLREHPERVASFAVDTARAWCHARQQRPRQFAEDALAALDEYPWPLNLRELEGVVIQTLAACEANLIRVDDLQYDGIAFAPINASEVATLIDTEPDTAIMSETVAAPATQPKSPAAETTPANPSIQPLVAAIAHEMRNPLSTIRTFAELLPSQYGDPEFRARFAELVSQDTHRLEDVIEQLSELAALGSPEVSAVDLSALLEEVLAERTERVRERQLLVLKELDEHHTAAIGDARQLRFALESVIDQSIALAPEGGDVFIASRHQPTGLNGRPAVRVLVRFGNHDNAHSGTRVPGTSPAENALAYAIAAAIIRAQGGTFSIDPGEGHETVLLVDIPA
jgi:DNA-binding NtrC family response regulator